MTSLAIELMAEDVGDLEVALAAAGLPIGDLRESDRLFLRFSDDVGPVGFAGLEGRGPDRLLRSVVVVDERRSSGPGRHVISCLETVAAGRGVATLHLLTTGAATFFDRLGYAVRDRAAAPDAIRVSREFAGLCRASATYMAKDLRR